MYYLTLIYPVNNMLSSSNLKMPIIISKAIIELPMVQSFWDGNYIGFASCPLHLYKIYVYLLNVIKLHICSLQHSFQHVYPFKEK